MLSGAIAATLCCESERVTATATIGFAPVHAAAQCGSVGSLEALVELRGEGVLSVLDGRSGLLPLHYAARGGAAALPSLRWLLRRPSVQAQVNRGPAPLPVQRAPVEDLGNGGRRTRAQQELDPGLATGDAGALDEIPTKDDEDAADLAPAEFVDRLPNARRQRAGSGSGACAAGTPLHLAASSSNGALVSTATVAAADEPFDKNRQLVRYGLSVVANQDGAVGRGNGCVDAINLLINAGASAVRLRSARRIHGALHSSVRRECQRVDITSFSHKCTRSETAAFGQAIWKY